MSTDYKPLRAPGKEPRLLGGQIVCNGSSSPAVVSGTGYSVARTDTGTLEVTVNDGRGSIISAVANSQFATPDVAKVEVSGVNHNASSITLTTTSGGSAFDFGSDLVIHFLSLASDIK